MVALVLRVATIMCEESCVYLKANKIFKISIQTESSAQQGNSSTYMRSCSVASRSSAGHFETSPETDFLVHLPMTPTILSQNQAVPENSEYKFAVTQFASFKTKYSLPRGPAARTLHLKKNHCCPCAAPKPEGQSPFPTKR